MAVSHNQHYATHSVDWSYLVLIWEYYLWFDSKKETRPFIKNVFRLHIMTFKTSLNEITCCKALSKETQNGQSFQLEAVKCSIGLSAPLLRLSSLTFWIYLVNAPWHLYLPLSEPHHQHHLRNSVRFHQFFSLSNCTGRWHHHLYTYLNDKCKAGGFSREAISIQRATFLPQCLCFAKPRPDHMEPGPDTAKKEKTT